jgi:DNA topoisomerase-2
VEYVVSQLTKKLVELIKKRRKIDVRPAQIRECLFLFVRAIVPNPTFDSQTKDTLTTPYTRFKSKLELDSKLIDKVAKLGIVDRVVQITSAVEDKASKKTDGKKRNTIRGIPKLDDANFAGTAKSAKCTLILTEGDSAKTMAISGLSEVGRDYYGVFPLKGKVMNVKDTTIKRINDNDEINHLKKILGLESNKSYDDVSSLRYGRLMIMTGRGRRRLSHQRVDVQSLPHHVAVLVAQRRVHVFDAHPHREGDQG